MISFRNWSFEHVNLGDKSIFSLFQHHHHHHHQKHHPPSPVKEADEAIAEGDEHEVSALVLLITAILCTHLVDGVANSLLLTVEGALHLILFD